MDFYTHVLNETTRALRGQTLLKELIARIDAVDRAFAQNGGVFFQATSDPLETADRFTAVHIRGYRATGARPSLPALALHHTMRLGIDKDSPAYKALLLVAAHAEMQDIPMPDYHSRFHYVDVTAVTANLLNASNLSLQDKALTLIAAVGHDMGHNGRTNPPADPVFNEQKSFDILRPILAHAGLTEGDIEKIRVIILATSPNGPNQALRHRAAYPGLKGLKEDKTLREMAGMVADADLYASAVAGMESSLLMSTLLTSELKQQGLDVNLVTDAARKKFMDEMIGTEGLISAAGAKIANSAYQRLYAETERRLKAQGKAPRP